MALRVLKIIPADNVVNSHIFIKYCCPTVARVLFLIPAKQEECHHHIIITIIVPTVARVLFLIPVWRWCAILRT